MGAGRFVGRVGGLAVALGVGAAVSLGAGIAWADESAGGGSESGGTSSASGGSAGGGASSGSSAPGATESGSAGAEVSSPTAGEAKSEVKTSAGSSHKRKPAGAKAAKNDATGAPKSTVSSRPAREDKDDEPGTGSSAPVKATPSAVAVSAPAATTVSEPPAAVPAAAVVSGSVRAVAGAVADASLVGGVPAGPLVNSPVLWAVAAASRREFAGGGNSSAKTAAVVSTGEPATALAAAAPAATANTAPVFGTPMVTTTDSSSGVVTGQALATDADGNTLKYSATATNGKVTINSSTGAFVYTPTAAARHAASATVNPVTQGTITVKVTDGKGGIASAAVVVDIAPSVNTDPTATHAVGKPNSATGAVTVTVKATDKDKDTLTYSVGTAPANGGVTVDAKGKFTYTPTPEAALAAGATTTDSFTFTVSDGHGGSFTDTVTVPIAPNGAPVNGVAAILKTNPTTGAVTGTIKASDPDKNTLTYSTESPATGTVTINAKTGAFTYTPTQAARQAAAEGVAGAQSDSFTVTITDSKGATNTQSVTVDISPNKAPISPTFTITSTNPSTGAVTGTVHADDPESDALTYTAGASVTGGKVKINAKTGVFTYTPTTAARHDAGLTVNPVTTDSFTATITDAKGASITTAVTVTVVPANVTPTATVTVGKPDAAGVVTGVVKGTDKDKDTLTYSAPATTTKGTVTIDATTGTFTYNSTAAARHAAAGTVAADKTDTFTVTITDAHGGTFDKLVSVTVAPANTAPTGGTGGGVTLGANGVVTGTLSATDADGDPLTYSAPAKSAKGTITITGSTFTYTPTDAARIKANAANATAADKADAFTVTVSDGHTGTTTFTVNVAVDPKGLSAVGGTVNVNGENVDAVMSKDGTRAIIATVTGDSTSGYTTSFTVINTTTGTKIGTAVQVTGREGWITFSDNATRALVATSVDEVDGTQSTRLAVINAGTGVQLGGTLNLAGYGYVDDVLQYNADQTRAILAIDGKDGSDDDVARVTVVNVTTGAQAGATRTFVGTQNSDSLFGDLSPVSVDLNADGSRIVVSTFGGDTASDGSVTTITVIETAGGSQLGATTSVSGTVFNPVQISNDGTRAVFAYTPEVDDVGDQTTKVVVLDLTSGGQVGATLSVAGQGAAQLSGDSSKLVVNSGIYDTVTGRTTTVISVYNAATGAQIGTGATAGDTATILPAQFNDAGTRAIVTGYGIASGSLSGVRVIVIDTATGEQVGSAVTVAGSPVGFNPVNGDLPLPIQLVANGTRAVVTTAPTGTTSNFAVINTTTGAQIGTTLNLTGTVTFNVEDTDTYLTPLFNADDSRAFLTTVTGTAASGYTTRIALLDTATGLQVGTTITLTGAPATYVGDSNLVAAGNRAVYFTNVVDSKGNYTTRVAIVNTDNGAQLGATRTFTGTYGAYVQISDDDRVTVLADTDTTSKLSVFNAVNGVQIGKTLTYSGSTWTWVTLTTDPNRALAFSVSGSTSKITAIDLTTATTIGTPLTLAGGLYYVYRDEASDRAVVTMQTGDAQTGYTTMLTTVQIKA